MTKLKILITKDIKQIKNYFLEFKTNRKKLIPLIFYIIWFSLIIKSQTETTYYSVNHFKKLSFSILSFLLIISIINTYFERNSYFSLADVNFLFTSPISPKIILLYSIFKTSWKQLLAALFMFLFLSVSLISAGISFPEILLGILAYSLFIFAIEPICFIILTLSKKYNLKIIISLLVFLILSLIFIPIIIEKSIIGGIESNLMNYIPLIGWCRAIFMSMFDLNYTIFIYLFLQISFIIIINIYIIISTDDYYEDVLSSTENKADYIEKRKSGKNSINFEININKNKKITFKKKHYGSEAFHWKNKITSIRKDFHYLYGIQTLLFLALSIIAVLSKQYKFKDLDYSTIFTILTIFTLYIYTLFSMRSGGQEELDMPIFYLIPENNIKKLISINKLTAKKMLINTIALFSIPAIIDFSNVFLYFLLFIMFNSVYCVINFSNILIRSFFRNETDFTLMLPLIKLVQLFLILFPSGIGALIGIFISSAIPIPLELILFTTIFISNILSILIILVFSDIIINRIEL
ncbi:MAG: putative ABC exporter domain-containing protein [Bacillota bacterium]|nr:putative ABC exporter domain-containing protein [Bacillota bacterium]